MNNVLEQMSSGAQWHLMVGAAKRAAEENGFTLDRVPGRGLSNVWNLRKNGQVKTTSIRTTRDRWIAFPPLENGSRWKTLSNVDQVLVAALDSKGNPKSVQVYLFDASEVRPRFDAAYAARTKAGQVVGDNFGMWVSLDPDQRGIPASVGSGLAGKHKPIAVYPIESLVAAGVARDIADLEPDAETVESQPIGNSLASKPAAEAPLTIGEAKRRLAITFGVDPSNIKITVEA